MDISSAAEDNPSDDVDDRVDKDIQITVLAKLCSNLATKARNSVGYHVQRMEKSVMVKCYVCDSCRPDHSLKKFLL